MNKIHMRTIINWQAYGGTTSSLWTTLVQPHLYDSFCSTLPFNIMGTIWY